jgi:hypothetical protein
MQDHNSQPFRLTSANQTPTKSIEQPMIRKSNLKIIIKLWIFAAIIAGSTQQSFAKCAEISPTRPGEVYFLRGLANIFSLGLDVMAKKVSADGVENCVFNHHHWKALANDIIERNYQKQISLPIVIVGHSLGANVAPQLATNLGRHGIPVSYVVMLDPVEAERIGVNVKEVVNYYLPKSKETRVFGTSRFTGQIENINVSHTGIDHFNIDENPALWNSIHIRIQQLTDPALIEIEKDENTTQ